jgi:ADP-ribosylglycohydrolase
MTDLLKNPSTNLGTEQQIDTIFGCILGTAIGDAVGLKREGMHRDRAIWLHGNRPSPDLIFGKGFCSDDTEHTVLVGTALLESSGEVSEFKKRFAKLLRIWLLTCPAGIGLGTLKAILKSFFFSPDHSGVKSAGNGPAMRAAILGVMARDDKHLDSLVEASTRITHSDPRAEEGALVVAKTARFAANQEGDALEFVRSITPMLSGDELKRHFEAMIEALSLNMKPYEFAESQGWAKGPTGYINQSVPMAICCWAHTPSDFQAVVSNAVLLGGDTDSVGAIAGAIAGAGCGADAIPASWKRQLAEWPRDIAWMRGLSEKLKNQARATSNKSVRSPSLRWGRTLIRNLIFGVVVIVLFMRRFIPFTFHGNAKQD